VDRRLVVSASGERRCEFKEVMVERAVLHHQNDDRVVPVQDVQRVGVVHDEVLGQRSRLLGLQSMADFVRAADARTIRHPARGTGPHSAARGLEGHRRCGTGGHPVSYDAEAGKVVDRWQPERSGRPGRGGVVVGHSEDV
jgi:hypothetical protein